MEIGATVKYIGGSKFAAGNGVCIGDEFTVKEISGDGTCIKGPKGCYMSKDCFRVVKESKAMRSKKGDKLRVAKKGGDSMKCNHLACEACGVVMDVDIVKSNIPPLYDGNGVLNEEDTYWDGVKYRRYVICPVCQHTNKQQGD